MLKVGRGAAAPPFLVMDVIAAANARQAALPPGAGNVIRMEVGQPGTGAPRGALEAAAAPLPARAPAERSGPAARALAVSPPAARRALRPVVRLGALELPAARRDAAARQVDRLVRAEPEVVQRARPDGGEAAPEAMQAGQAD